MTDSMDLTGAVADAVNGAAERGALAIADRPQVSLIYYGPGGPGAMYLSVRGVGADGPFEQTRTL